MGTSSSRASPAVGNASVDDTDVVVAATFFFATYGKSFVPTFNCSIHNASKYRTSHLLIHLCLHAPFFIGQMWLHRRGPKHGRIPRGWERWHRQRRGAMIELCYVWCICVIKQWLCIIVRTMDCRCDIYVLNFNCHWFAILNYCMCTVLDALHLGRKSKHGFYIKN
jgi:hypothetical protein